MKGRKRKDEEEGNEGIKSTIRREMGKEKRERKKKKDRGKWKSENEGNGKVKGGK